MNKPLIDKFVQESSGLTKSLIESLKDGVVLFDNKKEVILINDSMMHITGLPQEGFLISELTSLFKSKVNIQLQLDHALNNGKETFINDVNILKYFYEMRIFPVKDVAEKIIGGAIVFHDITYLKEIDQMKTEFISIASHQLRTPLTSIRWYTQMLYDGDAGKMTKKQTEFINEVHQGSIKMIELINSLLNVSRLEAGRIKIEPKPTDLIQVIKKAMQETKMIAAEKGKKCQIELNIKTKVPDQVMVDPIAFSQIIENFLSNAYRYTPMKNGKISVLFEEYDHSHFQISVTDNGIGIPLEMQNKLFVKFARAENAKKMVAEGSGLGLYIVKLLIESFHGKVWFKSTENQGTTFYFTLPKQGMSPRKGDRNLEKNY
ncbi:MAG: PAS domain-containing sensor histidine kinase [bacterium]